MHQENSADARDILHYEVRWILPLGTCRNSIKSQQRQAYSRSRRKRYQECWPSFDGDMLQTVRGQQQFGESPLPKVRSTSRIHRTLDRGAKTTGTAYTSTCWQIFDCASDCWDNEQWELPFQAEVSPSHMGRYLLLVLFSFTVALAGWQWRELHTLASSFWKSPAISQFRPTNSTATHVSVSSIEVLTPQSPEPSELAYEHAQSAIEETPTLDPSQERVAGLASSVSASTPGRNNSETEGEKYLYGDGVPANCVRARQDLLAAAEHSSAKAQSAMGTMYATGHCETRDLPLAYRWFARAQLQNPSNRIVEEDMRVLWNQMSPEERKLATR
jgi:hypothetical protein